MANILTTRSVEAAKPRRNASGRAIRTEIPDAGCSGLYLVVQPSGARSWALRYRRPGSSRTAKKTFSGQLTLAAARAAATAARLEIEQGSDPGPQRLRISAYGGNGMTVEAAAAGFLELHSRKIRPKTLENYEGILRNYIVPVWRGRSVDSIRRRDVIALTERIALTHGVTANRALATISKFFAWLLARDMIESSPAVGVERPHQEKPRRHILSDAELCALWLTCEGPYGAALQMLILTGARRNEVSRMTWTELDLQHRVWALPAERSKNGCAHTVHLSSQACDILQSLPRFVGCDFVFTISGQRPIGDWGGAKIQISAKAGLDISSWRLHDLRRTAASGMQKLGTPVHVIEKALNHVSGTFEGIVGTYQQHDYADEIRTALQHWADYVERLVTGESAKVVALHRN